MRHGRNIRTRQSLRGPWPQRNVLAARHGLSLLEVILALIILGGALVTIGELIRTGSRSARDARDSTTAQVIADSIMSEITAGTIAAQAIDNQADMTDPEWVYSIRTEEPNQDGLLLVSVTVQRADAISSGFPPSPSQSFTLTRWMLDPTVELAPPTDASGAATTTGSSSSGSTTTGAASGTGF